MENKKEIINITQGYKDIYNLQKFIDEKTLSQSRIKREEEKSNPLTEYSIFVNSLEDYADNINYGKLY